MLLKILFALLIIFVIYATYNSHKVIEAMTSEMKKNCLDGCEKPREMSGNCPSKIHKEKDGSCYRKCPYECPNPEDECEYDNNCVGCGFKKFKVNCDGTMIPSIDDDGNEVKDIKDETEKKYDEFQKKIDDGLSSIFTHDSGKGKKLKTEHHVYLHHVNHGCREKYHVRKGGIMSNDFKHKGHHIRGDKDRSSVYNYGYPGSPLDLKKQVDNFKVNYTGRPTTTGMFTNTGPYGFNIGNYKPYGKGCDFPANE